MARVLLAVWVGLFAVQATDVYALVAPDDCIGDVSSQGDDTCPTGTCLRCLCCAPAVAPVTPVTMVAISTASIVVDRPASAQRVPSPDPRRILHIPKTLR